MSACMPTARPPALLDGRLRHGPRSSCAPRTDWLPGNAPTDTGINAARALLHTTARLLAATATLRSNSGPREFRQLSRQRRESESALGRQFTLTARFRAYLHRKTHRLHTIHSQLLLQKYRHQKMGQKASEVLKMLHGACRSVGICSVV